MSQFIRVDGKISGEVDKSIIIQLDNIAGIEIGENSKAMTIRFFKPLGNQNTAHYMTINDENMATAILDYFEDTLTKEYTDLRPGYAKPKKQNV